jgi:hypothetical protein
MPPRRWLRPKLMPNNENTVAPRAIAEAPLRAPGLAPGSPIHLGRVRRPMTFSGPPMQTSHGNGMALRAQTGAATCASRTLTPCAVMGTKRRARRRNERRSLLISSPALSGAFFCRSTRAIAAGFLTSHGRGGCLRRGDWRAGTLWRDLSKTNLLFSPLEADEAPARVVPIKIVPWGERWPSNRRFKSRACSTSAG